MAVLFHISYAQIAVGITMSVYRLNFTFKFMVDDDHMHSRTKLLEN